MAFPVSAGYGNLPNGNFSPVIFSQKALKAFRKDSVIEDVTNTDYYGEISNYGDTVRIIREPDITITPYVRGAVPPTQQLQDDDFTITVDKANAFQFAIDDIENKQSHVNWETLASNRAAYVIKDAYDAEVFNYMAGVGLAASNIGTTSAAALVQANVSTPSNVRFTPLNLMARAKRIMDLLNVPDDNRFFVGDPYFYEQLSDENSKILNNDYTDKGILRNGRVSNGTIRGFTLYESNNLPVGGTGPTASDGSTNYGTLIFGHKSAVATVSQIAKTEKFRSPNTFADVVRGLHMYGRGLIRAEGLVIVRYTVTD